MYIFLILFGSLANQQVVILKEITIAYKYAKNVIDTRVAHLECYMHEFIGLLSKLVHDSGKNRRYYGPTKTMVPSPVETLHHSTIMVAMAVIRITSLAFYNMPSRMAILYSTFHKRVQINTG